VWCSHAPVAQLDRALVSGTKGRRFESYRVYQINYIMQSYLPIISAILALISPIVYARAIFKGDARPHRVTRFVLMVISVLTLASIFARHDYVAIWLAAATAIQAIFLFLLTLKYGMGGSSKVDIACLVIALSGIVLWQITNQPILGLYCAIGADFMGMIPAILKTYKNPETEVWSFFAIDLVAGALTVIATTDLTIQNFSYPVYILLINAVMVAIILKGSVKKIFANS
jgi:hypothetical protein